MTHFIHFFHVFFSVLLFVIPAATARAITIIDTDRVVFVSSFIDANGVFVDSSAEGVQSTTKGSFQEVAVGGTGFGGIVNARGEATQASTIEPFLGDGLSIEAGGAAGAAFDVNDFGFPSRSKARSDSSLSIRFEVSTPRPYAASIALEAELGELTLFVGGSSLSSEIISIARLSGLTSGIVFERMLRDETEDDGALSDVFTTGGILEPDIYLLEVFALADLGGLENASGFGTSGYGVSFEVVPEPGTAILLGLGLACLPRRRAVATRAATRPIRGRLSACGRIDRLLTSLTRARQDRHATLDIR